MNEIIIQINPMMLRAFDSLAHDFNKIRTPFIKRIFCCEFKRYEYNENEMDNSFFAQDD